MKVIRLRMCNGPQITAASHHILKNGPEKRLDRFKMKTDSHPSVMTFAFRIPSCARCPDMLSMLAKTCTITQ